MRNGEDNVEVWNVKQVFRSFDKPLVASVGLALRTVTVAAGVIRDGLMAASGTSVQMAPESRGAAIPDGVQHFQLWPGQMSLVPFDEAVACDANDVGHLKGGPFHLLSSF